MKLQKEEIAALSSYIYQKIQEKNKATLTKSEEKEIERDIKKFDLLKKDLRELKEEVNQEKKRLTDKYSGAYSYNDLTIPTLCAWALNKKGKKIPSQNEIRNEIILKNLFSDEKEMEKFVQDLINKY